MYTRGCFILSRELYIAVTFSCNHAYIMRFSVLAHLRTFWYIKHQYLINNKHFMAIFGPLLRKISLAARYILSYTSSTQGHVTTSQPIRWLDSYIHVSGICQSGIIIDFAGYYMRKDVMTKLA